MNQESDESVTAENLQCCGDLAEELPWSMGSAFWSNSAANRTTLSKMPL